jgi:hypothetical protein
MTNEEARLAQDRDISAIDSGAQCEKIMVLMALPGIICLYQSI